MGNYETIKAQLTADVGAALGEGAKVVYGRVLKPKKAGEATGSIFTSVDRANVGRQVQETFTFQIALLIPLPPATTDVEGTLMGYASALVLLLAPYSTDGTVPSSAGPYAGIASLRRVSGTKPMEREDADQHAGVVLTFSCMATVLQ